MRFPSVLGFAVTLLTAATLHAQGVTLVEQETADGATSTNQIQMDRTHLRVESGAAGRRIAFVYDAAATVMRIINLDRQTYTEIDKAQIDQIRNLMTAMQEKMKSLPPQQREMVEQMMKGRGMAPAAGPQFKQLGSDTVGKWPCTKYEGSMDGRKFLDLCAADPAALGLSMDDFEVARQLAAFASSLAPQAAQQANVFGMGGAGGFSGVPVRRTMFTDGKATSVSELKEVKRGAIPASTWEVPAGFKRESMGVR